jgi:hypothetical protein
VSTFDTHERGEFPLAVRGEDVLRSADALEQAVRGLLGSAEFRSRQIKAAVPAFDPRTINYTAPDGDRNRRIAWATTALILILCAFLGLAVVIRRRRLLARQTSFRQAQRIARRMVRELSNTGLAGASGRCEGEVARRIIDGLIAYARLGIGRPPDGVEPETFVLERFTPDERSVIDDAIERAAHAALAVVSDGLETAMNRVNMRETAPPAGARRRPPAAKGDAPPDGRDVRSGEDPGPAPGRNARRTAGSEPPPGAGRA